MVTIERYATMRQFRTDHWSIGDRAMASEMGPRIVAQGLTGAEARAEVERMNREYTAQRYARAVA